MTRPRRFLLRVSLFMVAVIAVAIFLIPAITPSFMANPALNGFIIGVLMVGVFLNIRQIVMIGPEVDWIDRFSRDETGVSSQAAPRLLAPMATMLREHKGRGRFTLSAPAMRSVLDGIASRLDEARDVSRYFIGLSIFLGLLGTFWGLLQTIGSISDVISSLDVSGSIGGDATGVFSDLKAGLERPLSGMGTAFSSSLFGLAGALVLGFLDLQTGQAQNAFYNELEDWLSAITRLTSGFSGGEGDQSVPVYIQALLEQNAESISELQRTLARGEESRGTALGYQRDLVDRLSTLTDQMRAEQQVLMRMAESQIELKTVIQRLGDTNSQNTAAIDDATRGHIRNMDISIGRLVEETARGRDDAVKEMRSEIKLLARTIAALAEGKR